MIRPRSESQCIDAAFGLPAEARPSNFIPGLGVTSNIPLAYVISSFLSFFSFFVWMQ